MYHKCFLNLMRMRFLANPKAAEVKVSLNFKSYCVKS